MMSTPPASNGARSEIGPATAWDTSRTDCSKGVECDRVERKVRANLALYEPETVGHKVQVSLFDGRGCSAILMGYLNREESVLLPIGYQLGCIWMDVRYQDGDSWGLSIYEGAEHRVSHNVNPWANGDKYNQEHVDYRIRRICELWPEHAPQNRTVSFAVARGHREEWAHQIRTPQGQGVRNRSIRLRRCGSDQRFHRRILESASKR